MTNTASTVLHFDVYPSLAPSDVVFIHGNLASNTWWEPSLEVWSKQALTRNDLTGRLLMGEWLGCGKSPAPEQVADLHPRHLAQLYINDLRKLGADRVSIVAHSTGGTIALYMLLAEPAMFDRVVLLDSVSARGVQFDPAALEAFTQMSQDREFCAAVMNATIHANNAASHLFQCIVDDAFGIAKINWQGVPAVLHDINLMTQLPKIQQPTLVLHGEHDVVLPVAGSEELAANLPHARFELLKGQGHSTNVENPALFVQLVNSFLFNGGHP